MPLVKDTWKFYTSGSKQTAQGSKERNNTVASAQARPPNSFFQWLRLCWLDILVMALLGALALVVFLKLPPAMAKDRLFSVYNVNGTFTNPELAYPWRHEYIPIWLSGLLSVLVPILIYILMALRIRSFWDLNNAIMGTCYATLGATIFQLTIKTLVGGFRPHFLELCKPSIPNNGTNIGDGFGNIYYDISVCKGLPRGKYGYWEALESFPSGHTTSAFAGAVFLSLYLNAKLKLLANYQPHFWKLIIVFAPLLGATIQGGVLTIDGYHQVHDILTGAIIGTLFAFFAYRMMYAALFDFRFNHIPLLKHHGFLYHSGDDHYTSLYDAVFTHKASWGVQGTLCLSGAPGDVWVFQENTSRSPPNTYPNTTAVEAGLSHKPSRSCQRTREPETPASNKQFQGDSHVEFSTSPSRYGGSLPDVENGLHF